MPRAAADRVGRTAARAMAKKHALVARACARVCVVIVNFKPAACRKKCANGANDGA
jgi:hypothetical protein